jgi:hypothetical protein
MTTPTTASTSVIHVAGRSAVRRLKSFCKSSDTTFSVAASTPNKTPPAAPYSGAFHGEPCPHSTSSTTATAAPTLTSVHDVTLPGECHGLG